MKPILLILFIILSFTGYSQTIGTGQIKDGAVTEPKLSQNALRPIDGGVLTNPELTFDEAQKTHTISVTSDIALTLAGSGNINYSRIYLTASGDGSHTLSFPPDWKIDPAGEAAFNPNAVNEIEINYRSASFVLVKIIVDELVIDFIFIGCGGCWWNQ